MSADFRVGEWIVRPKRHLIERGDESVHIKPKPMFVLEVLAAANGEPVTRNELFDTIWPGGEVSDDVLTKCVVELRKAFGDSAHESRVIETIPKLGFRLVLPVERLDSELKTGAEAATAYRRRRHWDWCARPSVRLIVLVVLCAVVLLSIRSARLWFTEAAVTVFMETAAVLDPYPLDQRPGIAVLPFLNMSNDPENEYFSDDQVRNLL